MEGQRVGKQISMEIQRMLNKELGEHGVSIFRNQCKEMGIKLEEIQLKDLLNLSQRMIRALRPIMGNDKAQRIGKEIQKFKILSELKDINSEQSDMFTERRELDAYLKLANISYTIGDWDDALGYYKRVIRICKKLGEKNKMAEAQRNTGHIFKRQSEWDEAIKSFEASLESLKDIASAVGIADAYRGLGYVYWRKGDYGQAKSNFKIAMENAEKSGDKSMIGMVHIESGLVDSDTGELENAVNHYLESIKLLEDAREWQQLSRAYNNLGDTFLQLKEWKDAIKYFELCKESAIKINHISMIGWSLFNTGEALAMSGNPDEAIEKCSEAIEILDKLHDHVGVSAAYRNLGVAFRFKKDWGSAENSFKEAETRLDKIKSPFNSAHLDMEWGIMYTEKGEKPEAKKHLKKAANVFGDLGAHKYLEKVNEHLKDL
ncbi:MAG: tetratricopeptide repeat protein [Thermoplasmata archaeon]|nr:tetratricopeptide repeat protein [Thermoplasmata archaeon]